MACLPITIEEPLAAPPQEPHPPLGPSGLGLPYDFHILMHFSGDFCGLKLHQISFPPTMGLTAPPDLLAGGRVPTLLLTKSAGLFQDFPGPHDKFGAHKYLYI